MSAFRFGILGAAKIAVKFCQAAALIGDCEVWVNGFTYEMEEVIRCIREGKQESLVVPWKDTLECARLFDRIEATRA